jgi:hypothetical protein
MGQLSSIQAGILTLLQAEPYFSDITILEQDAKELEFKIAEAVGRIGVCVIIEHPKMTVPNPNVPGPYGAYTVSVFVYENTIINRSDTGTGKVASDIAEYVASTCHLKWFDALAETMKISRDAISMIDQGGENNEELVWVVKMETTGGINLSVPAVATPGIADNGSGTLTLTCATGGAAMFYTVDNTAPSPRNGTLYTAPFAVGSGVKTRVTGWLAGYTVSAESSYTRA